MPETIFNQSLTGPLPTYNKTLDAVSPVFLTTGGVYQDFYVSRLPSRVIDPTASGSVIHLMSAITASTSAQTASVSDTGFMVAATFVTGAIEDYWVIDPGLATQELVMVRSIGDDTHFDAIFRANHAAGAILKKVFSWITLFYNLNVDPLPSPNGIGNVGFIRRDPLPSGILDQYILRGTTSSFSYSEDTGLPWISESGSGFPLPVVPQFSPASLTVTGNPSNGVTINAGPITSGPGPITPSVNLQILFTVYPEPLMLQLPYRWFWDDL